MSKKLAHHVHGGSYINREFAYKKEIKITLGGSRVEGCGVIPKVIVEGVEFEMLDMDSATTLQKLLKHKCQHIQKED